MVIFEIALFCVCEVLPESTSGVNRICDFDHKSLQDCNRLGGDEMCVRVVFFYVLGVAKTLRTK